MILDCTIRDGGHLCEWNFSKDFVDEVYNTACKSGVDFFEIGYRMHKKSKGLYSLCPDEILPEGSAKLVIMVNVSDFDISDFKENGRFLVRIACRNNEVKQGILACEELYNRGYGVFLHLMNADTLEDYDILEKWQNKNILESIYFADSFGSFTPDATEKYFNKLKSIGFDKISFHGHNNIQTGFANSIKALSLGAYSVDGSAYGMGRGAGNTPIELLLGHFGKTHYYDDLIKKYFIELKSKYNWGYNLETLNTGLKNIHPTKTLV